MYVCMYVCVCVYVCVYIYIYIYIYIYSVNIQVESIPGLPARCTFTRSPEEAGHALRKPLPDMNAFDHRTYTGSRKLLRTPAKP